MCHLNKTTQRSILKFVYLFCNYLNREHLQSVQQIKFLKIYVSTDYFHNF
jgi:hypothetical protein